MGRFMAANTQVKVSDFSVYVKLDRHPETERAVLNMPRRIVKRRVSVHAILPHHHQTIIGQSNQSTPPPVKRPRSLSVDQSSLNQSRQPVSLAQFMANLRRDIQGEEIDTPDTHQPSNPQLPSMPDLDAEIDEHVFDPSHSSNVEAGHSSWSDAVYEVVVTTGLENVIENCKNLFFFALAFVVISYMVFLSCNPVRGQSAETVFDNADIDMVEEESIAQDDSIENCKCSNLIFFLYFDLFFQFRNVSMPIFIQTFMFFS